MANTVVFGDITTPEALVAAAVILAPRYAAVHWRWVSAEFGTPSAAEIEATLKSLCRFKGKSISGGLYVWVKSDGKIELSVDKQLGYK